MLLFLPFNINIITNGSYKIRWFLPIIFDSFFPFVRRHTGYSTKFSKKYGQQPQKLTTQTKINQIPPQQYLIYISTYRPSFTLKLPDILPSERDLACPNYKLPPKSATKQSWQLKIYNCPTINTLKITLISKGNRRRFDNPYMQVGKLPHSTPSFAIFGRTSYGCMLK